MLYTGSMRRAIGILITILFSILLWLIDPEPFRPFTPYVLFALAWLLTYWLITIEWVSRRLIAYASTFSPRRRIGVYFVAGAIGCLLGVAYWAGITKLMYARRCPPESRMEIYQEFQEERTRRIHFYGEGFFKQLTIESHIADQKRIGRGSNPTLDAEIKSRIEEYERWSKEKGERDAAFSGILARIKVCFPRTPQSDMAIAALSEGIPMSASEPPTDRGQMVRQQWAEDQADQFKKLLEKQLKEPASQLTTHMERNMQ